MNQLRPQITRYGLMFIAIGSMVGSGIFGTPSVIAGYLPSATWMLVVWSIGGLIAMTGALTLAEPGALLPKTGGMYAFLKEAYHPLVGFLFGWAMLVVINTGSIAALCVLFAQYVAYLIPMSDTGVTLLGLGAIVFITLVNVFGAKVGERFSVGFTVTKLAGILGLIGIGLIGGSLLLNDWSGTLIEGTGSQAITTPSLNLIGLALIGVVFSFGGFQHASFVASEVKRPGRDIPFAMIAGVAVVCVVYLGANVAYLALLPVDQVAASPSLAATAVETVWATGGLFIAALIAISTLGTALIYTLSAPRIYFAMAEDGAFFPAMARVHPRFKSPVNAIVLQSAWAMILLIFLETFQQLITFVVFVDWIFFALAGASIFILRRQRPDVPRPYRTAGYPITPLIFVSLAIFIVINTLIGEPRSSVYGLIFLGLGVGVFAWFQRRKDQAVVQ